MSRALSVIAAEIRRDWKKVNYAAVPYLNAIGRLSQITDKYYLDDGRSIVMYFLANAGTWRGPVARSIKAELKQMIGD